MSQEIYTKGQKIAIKSGRYARKLGHITRPNSKLAGFYWVSLNGEKNEITFGQNQLCLPEELHAPSPPALSLAQSTCSPEAAVIPEPDPAPSETPAINGTTGGTRELMPRSVSIDPANFRWRRYQYSSLPERSKSMLIDLYKQELLSLAPDVEVQISHEQWINTWAFVDPLLEYDERETQIRIITGWEQLQNLMAASCTAAAEQVPYFSKAVKAG